MTKLKEITLAKYAGFCYGVKRAVDSVKKLKSENPDVDVCVLGELIHNAQVIEELESFGIKSLKALPEKGSGICVVRTHGESPQTFDSIHKAGFDIHDLTCPDVKKVQKKAIELVQKGYYLIIVGKEAHPEVSAIKFCALQYGDKVVVAASVEDLKRYESDIHNCSKVGVVVQTTQTLSTLNPIVEYLIKISKELRVINTICPSTSHRQAEARDLALKNDLMIIVGSKNSANTTHLADIAREYTTTIHIETAAELELYSEIIAKSLKIAITAGASTPQSIIDDVLKNLQGANL